MPPFNTDGVVGSVVWFGDEEIFDPDLPPLPDLNDGQNPEEEYEESQFDDALKELITEHDDGYWISKEQWSEMGKPFDENDEPYPNADDWVESHSDF
jgi:hypothetical protein